MAHRRHELILKCLDFFLEHGLADLSLRPLAGHAGTSARMLVYHFGSREGLVMAVLDEAHGRILDLFSRMAADPGPSEGEPFMRVFWRAITTPEILPLQRLCFEVQALALQNPEAYGRFQERLNKGWLARIEAALPPSRDRRALATLCSALFDGLLLDLLGTGDAERAEKALELFTNLLLENPARLAQARLPRPGESPSGPDEERT